ncbi:prepilin-type N-terminal cleavage/methylation domain-containing protein [Sporosarcina sp. PTS2304]|uniref:prepilin-type N-terminal cleavage/methylation domain-containing protein n=1 Tax=Sporosarcina sp. PTS2304 TaxID=2283194 RepID=UPI000E0D3240|nr:prepilin-type N-terminal cleavage/methylation domain-containing protein [Sporosarcina sp. PTS2304]AXH99316.1 prepilin-type N-terminal cleavage/methylation domain-containing protein [Sporosarcina sp. PTS2304]
MKKFLQKKLNQKGLTLVELLAVIVILGIIAAIAVPAIGNIIENTKYNAVKADALNALNAANMYFTETPKENSVTIETLVTGGYLENAGKLPPTGTVANGNPKKISTAAIDFAGGKTVTFTGATIDSINADTTKGSAVTAQTIN